MDCWQLSSNIQPCKQLEMYDVEIRLMFQQQAGLLQLNLAQRFVLRIGATTLPGLCPAAACSRLSCCVLKWRRLL